MSGSNGRLAVMYGAGNIGRGFIGKVFSDSGYDVCFIDIAKDIIDEMNARGGYTVNIVSARGEHSESVKNIFAVDGNTAEAVGHIAACDIMATAVGVNVMKYIAPVIARGIGRRMEAGGGPLDIILAENQLDADQIMRGYIYEHLGEDARHWADDNLGLVEASIGRMVPNMPAAERAGDPLRITVEEYALLPVDSQGFKGAIPPLVGLVPYSPFGFYIKRKLFIHNMGHALCAYLGWRKGCHRMDEAMGNEQIRNIAQAAMRESAKALAKEYGVPMEELEDHIQDLLSRFQIKALNETIARVGGDPIRKLRRDDRLVGAALYVMGHGGDPSCIVEGIAAALRYDDPDDQNAVRLQDDLREKGLDHVIQHYMSLKPEEPLAGMIKKAYRKNRA